MFTKLHIKSANNGGSSRELIIPYQKSWLPETQVHTQTFEGGHLQNE